MKTISVLAFATALSLPLPALSHQPDIPKDAPPGYQTECGSCHIAYLPALLPEAEWRSIMAQLNKHYGDNASLEEGTRREIEDFLARNAGSRWRLLFGSGDPPRLTATVWFNHEHNKLPEAIWADQKVGSRSNCAACHPDAAKGLFDEHTVKPPTGYGFHD